MSAAEPRERVDTFDRLAAVIASRHPAVGGDPAASYVARLLQRGTDAILKKVGEEATEVVMAAKDLSAASGDTDTAGPAREHLVGEVADLWFHCLVMLAHFDLHPADVLGELARREGVSGIEEKALRKMQARERDAPAED